ncbi:hypothetical protein [Vineibacter terrae]|uniref:hypothetical protein n=1 Tax=Vineibacter terrae TaxID=2586908 RepID=UPI0015B52B6D|nr:hypothetical protein [Vineibacter terrae]
MMRVTIRILGTACALLALAACGTDYGRKAALVTPDGPTLSANVGGTVMDVRIMRAPPSPYGLLNVDGREVTRVMVRFDGVQGGRAVLVRNDLVLDTRDAAVLWVPVGVTSPDGAYAAAAQPITLALGPGEYYPLEGKRLIVRRVSRDTLEYTVE